MTRMQLTLRGRDLELLTLNFNVLSVPIAQKWAQILHSKIQAPEPFGATEFKAFTAAGRDAETCWREVLEACDVIAEFNAVHLPSQYRQLTRNQDSLNRLHKSFEIMRGEAQYGTEFFELCPAPVQKAIEDLNERIHETESAQGFGHGVGGIIKVNLTDRERHEFADEDYNNFSLSRDFGDVYLHYCQVGKPWADVFLDKDRFVGEDNIRPLRHYTGEFDIGFRSSNFHGSEAFVRPFYHWLKERGLDPAEPKLSLGWSVVAKLDTTNLAGWDQRRICREVGLRPEIATLTFSE